MGGRSYGATVFGFLNCESGLGEAGRRVALALAASGLPTAAKSLPAGQFQDGETGADHLLTKRSSYRYHLFAINADNTAHLPHRVVEDDWRDRYRIGIWAWELAGFPDAFLPAFDHVDEVWGLSQFNSAAIAAMTDKPVFTAPCPVLDATPDRRFSRAYFGLDPTAMTVLAAFDFNSYNARKNPLGAVEAFRRAFPRPTRGVQLVVKAHGVAKPGEREALSRALGGLDNTVLIDRVLSRAEVTGLQASADVFVSMHRSEGFGLNIAECMAQAKLAVATDYSGSTDFLDADCGAPVRYHLTAVKPGTYPHAAGQAWAEPDLDHAAEHLRRAADDPAWRLAQGLKAQARVRRQLSLRAVGYRLRGRIDDLEHQLGDSA